MMKLGSSRIAYQPGAVEVASRRCRRAAGRCRPAPRRSAGRHRAGGHEDRHDGQSHRDLVRDHLGARPQAAEQRVGRAGGPAAEHDAVDAHRGAGQHHQHGHRHVGELQRRLLRRRCVTIGPNGITESAVNAQIAEIIGAKKKTTLSAAFGMMSSLNAIFRPSARVCSRPNGPDLVGAGAHLHPGRRPGARTRSPNSVSQHQEDEDDDDLDQHDPPGVLAEVGEGRILGQIQPH